jgi:pseudouridine synthase
MVASESAVRLHVFLAKQGVGSRRELESWIQKGLVQVNGKPARVGQKIEPASDKIKIRGKPIAIHKPSESVVLALHKPRGIVTTVKDPEGRKTVMDLIPKMPRLFPVGRLDLQSEGLILMTNDGELALRMTHPRYEVDKVYDVKIRGQFDDKKLAFLKKGVRTDEGKFKGAEVLSLRDVTDTGVKKYLVTIKVFEGRNHHVRKMFDAVKCRVIRLKRISFGPISLKGIPRGGYRYLTRHQVQNLRQSLGL